MIELQILNYILDKKDFNIITSNLIDDDYFKNYKQEFDFINKHYVSYGIIPDKETFASKFKNFEFIQVEESYDYLISELRKYYLQNRMIPVLTTAATQLKDYGPEAGVEYLMSALPKLTQKLEFRDFDIIKQSKERFEIYIDKSLNKKNYYISTGYVEWDDAFGGFNIRNELIFLAGRPGSGKSFVAAKIGHHIAKIGYRVNIYTGEMNEEQYGNRIDTIHSGVSNYKITRGFNEVREEYKKGLESLNEITGKIMVTTPESFGGFPTAQKLKAWCEKRPCDFLIVDQISLMENENGSRGKTATQNTEEITKQLKIIQSQLQIPILVLSQLGRTAANAEELGGEMLANSDRMLQDGTIVIGISRKKDTIIFEFLKIREATTGIKLTYNWEIDRGSFIYLHSNENREEKTEEYTTRKSRSTQEVEKSGDSVF